MFRESSAIDSERTASGVRALYAKYSENEEWFTGTPDSVDRRIAQCKRIANAAKAASVRLAGRDAGIQYIALAQEMDSDRTALEGLRRDLLTASSDRESAVSGYYDEVDTDADRSEHAKWHDHDTYHGFGPRAKRPDEFGRDSTGKDGKHRAEARFSDRYAEEGFSYGHGDDTVDKGTIDGPPAEWSPGQTGSDHQDHVHQGALRPEARLFIAEQECDDLGELLIRAQRHAERVSSTLPARQSRAHVASFVEAVRAAAPYSDPGRKKGWDWDKGHRPSEDSTEHGDVSHDGVANKPPRNNRQASLGDFPADLMYLE